ncbi:MAG TPA: hypothetical protein VIL64_03800 [Solirubrobacteraceae bacterium]
MSPLDPEVRPTGEEIHLPGPTVKPILLAFAITIALVGVTLSWLLTIAGGILAVSIIVAWVGDTRRNIDSLPLEHNSH